MFLEKKKNKKQKRKEKEKLGFLGEKALCLCEKWNLIESKQIIDNKSPRHYFL